MRGWCIVSVDVVCRFFDESAVHSMGDGHPCFVAFEAGPTHDGLATACRLAGVTAEAGADAVTVQMVDPDRLVSDRRQLFTYDVLVDRENGRWRSSSTIVPPAIRPLRTW